MKSTVLSFKTTIYYTDKEWLEKAKICAALKKRSFSGLVKDLVSEAIADKASKSIDELNPHQHNPPGMYEERREQVRKFRRMSKGEMEIYNSILEKHVELFRNRKNEIDPLW